MVTKCLQLTVLAPDPAIKVRDNLFRSLKYLALQLFAKSAGDIIGQFRGRCIETYFLQIHVGTVKAQVHLKQGSVNCLAPC